VALSTPACTLFSLLVVVAILCTLPAALPAQPQRDTARARQWYDTLTPTKPRLAVPTPGEITTLRAASAVVIPVMFTVATATLIPPEIGVNIADGTATPVFLFGTGVGFGGDTALTTFFPDFRLQAAGAVMIASERPVELRLSLHRDLPVFSLDRRDLFWLGVDGGAGVATTFDNLSPFAEGWIGVMSPMGVRFIGFFPMHHYGLRARVGYNAATDRAWYELSVGATATFWF